MLRPPKPRGGRLAASALGALAVLAVTAPSALASEQATFRLLGSSPIYASSVQVHKAAGGDVSVRPARYHYRITTPSGVAEASGNCVDLSHYIVTGRDYTVDLQSAADAPELGSPEFKAAGYLLSRSDDLIAAAANPGLEAGALQVAIWQLSGQARALDAPTSDVVLNARVSALRAMAAGKSLPSDVGVSVAGGNTCLDTAAQVTVTGTPGAAVDLDVPSGNGTVSPATVTLDALGVGSAQLRATGGEGTVTVEAETSAPTLLRATKLPGQSTPQDQLFLRPGVLEAEASHGFIDCELFLLAPETPGTTIPLEPSAPAAPAPPPPPAAPLLALELDTPHLAAPGGVTVYRLRVSNEGTGTARNVKVGQHLGRGIAPISARGPKGSSSKLGRGTAHWKLAALKPGQSATLTLRVRVGREMAGGVAHTSAAVRSAKSRASASGATAVVRRVGKTEQGF